MNQFIMSGFYDEMEKLALSPHKIYSAVVSRLKSLGVSHPEIENLVSEYHQRFPKQEIPEFIENVRNKGLEWASNADIPGLGKISPEMLARAKKEFAGKGVDIYKKHRPELLKQIREANKNLPKKGMDPADKAKAIEEMNKIYQSPKYRLMKPHVMSELDKVFPRIKAEPAAAPKAAPAPEIENLVNEFHQKFMENVRNKGKAAPAPKIETTPASSTAPIPAAHAAPSTGEKKKVWPWVVGGTAATGLAGAGIYAATRNKHEKRK